MTDLLDVTRLMDTDVDDTGRSEAYPPDEHDIALGITYGLEMVRIVGWYYTTDHNVAEGIRIASRGRVSWEYDPRTGKYRCYELRDAVG